MPIYKYKCSKYKEPFEVFVRGDEKINHPECGMARVIDIRLG